MNDTAAQRVTRGVGRTEPTEFRVWGCRGSRSFVPGRSRVGNLTSCYSLVHGQDLVVLDAGRGLAALGGAVGELPRYLSVRRVFIFVGHAHIDHWEGLKDADWFWRRDLALDIRIFGRPEALRAIRGVYAHPSYVTLELLASKTIASVSFHPLGVNAKLRLGPWRVRTGRLHHYSGEARKIQTLDAIGFHVTTPDGGRVAYLSDHEPTSRTLAMEEALHGGAHLAVCDAHFPDVREHAHGHGSQEYAAALARAHPRLRVLAGHHGPLLTDSMLRAAERRHARGARNYELAVEGVAYRFDAVAQAFHRERRTKG